MTSPAPIRPLSLPPALLFFGVPALLFLALQRLVLPWLEAAGVPLLVGFFAMAVPHVLFFLAALAGYRREGNPWRWAVLAARFRLTRLGARGWAWAAAAAAGNVGLYLGVYFAARPAVRWLYELFPDPEVVGRVLGDATTMAGYPLRGNAWLLGVYFVLYFFNVMGEELWWRGYLLPRQELVHGGHTWVVHGLLWTAFHLFSPYNALMVLPGALFVSWIVQRERNTWIFVVAHATLNGLAMIRIIGGIWG